MISSINKNLKIGFTCGAFDLTHAGHYIMFKECREQCDYLIVGLQDDPSIDREYKNKPIQSLAERKIQLESCKYIDEIVIYKTEKDLVKLLKKIKPNIRFVGADWKGKHFTGDNLSINVVFNSRSHTYSSSSLRRRVYESEKKIVEK